MNNIFLIEDHDEALKIWRQKEIKRLDLVHIDAHIDFAFHPARPVKKIFNEARSLKELKENLEYSLAFRHYENDLDKQTNIGNYIYPAMKEGIVKDFYWVVPGRLKQFKESVKFIKNIVKKLQKCTRERSKIKEKDGIVSIKFLERKLIICILEKLPCLKQSVLLDIDTDFLVIDSLKNANKAAKIGKRQPWTLPQDLVGTLKEKIIKPRIITIAYSVNGGYTPIKYKYLGDEIAYYLAPEKFKEHFKNKLKAAECFNLFTSTQKKEYYQKAIELNPTYRAADNNYGLLYLSLRKFSLAQKEFLRILEADSENPGGLLGLGMIALEKKDFEKAKRIFSSLLNAKASKLSTKVKRESLFGLARAEFRLKNLKRAKGLLVRYQAFESLNPERHYLLGNIFEKEKKYFKAAVFYKDAIRLGFSSIEPLCRLLKIARYLKEKHVIIEYIIIKYKRLKKMVIKAKRLSLKTGRKTKASCKVEEKILVFEKKLQQFL